MQNALLPIVIIFNSLLAFGQDSECSFVDYHKLSHSKSPNEVSLVLDHVPFVIEESEFPATILKFKTETTIPIESLVTRLYEYCDKAFINVTFLDDGSNGDEIAGDGIYTSSRPICYNENTPFNFNFELNRLRTTIVLTNGVELKFMTRLGTYSLNPQVDTYDRNLEVYESSDDMRYTENVVNIIADKSYHPQIHDYDLDEVKNRFMDRFSSETLDGLFTLSFFDTNLNTNSYSAVYVNGKDIIQTFGDFSTSLLNHELTHRWVNSANSYGFSQNNGHWGFIEQPHSGFGEGCFHGVFSSIDNENGVVRYKEQPNNYEKYAHYNDLELALMGLQSVDAINFPIKFYKNPQFCDNGLLSGGELSSMSKVDFLQQKSQSNVPSLSNNSLEYKFVIVTEEFLSDLEMRFLDYLVTSYAESFKESTSDLATLNTHLDLHVVVVDEDEDGYDSEVDCDDTNPHINPGQVEIANNDIDENCDGEELIIDLDQDGYHSDIDCDDLNPSINPGQKEKLGNQIDEDCDNNILTIDNDKDGYDNLTDCDDSDPLINPGMEEIYNNNQDENCDGCSCKRLPNDN